MAGYLPDEFPLYKHTYKALNIVVYILFIDKLWYFYVNIQYLLHIYKLDLRGCTNKLCLLEGFQLCTYLLQYSSTS